MSIKVASTANKEQLNLYSKANNEKIPRVQRWFTIL